MVGDPGTKAGLREGRPVALPERLGSVATAEGVFTALPLTLEQTRNYLQHEAQCQGEAFDVESIEEPMTLYRIQGTGAIVEEPAVEETEEPAPETDET